MDISRDFLNTNGVTQHATATIAPIDESKNYLHPLDWLPLFFGIALFIGLCNLPFAAIQRYNRFRLVHLLGRMEAKFQVRS